MIVVPIFFNFKHSVKDDLSILFYIAAVCQRSNGN